MILPFAKIYTYPPNVFFPFSCFPNVEPVLVIPNSFLFLFCADCFKSSMKHLMILLCDTYTNVSICSMKTLPLLPAGSFIFRIGNLEAKCFIIPRLTSSPFYRVHKYLSY